MVCETNTESSDWRLTHPLWSTNNPANGTGGKPALFAGHQAQMNVVFADGHAKATRPMQTISTAMGGGGSINMWERHGLDYTADNLTRVRTALTNATNFYK